MAVITALEGAPGHVPRVALGATERERSALRDGTIDALVAPRPAELGRRGVAYAVAAAANRPDLMPRAVQLTAVVLTRADIGTARERQAAYPDLPQLTGT